MEKVRKKKAPNDPVLIWSNGHQRWWRSNANGYTADLVQAGIYRRSDALSQTFGRGDYDGAIVEPSQIAMELWKRREEQLARTLIFRLGLLPGPGTSRTPPSRPARSI